MEPAVTAVDSLAERFAAGILLEGEEAPCLPAWRDVLQGVFRWPETLYNNNYHPKNTGRIQDGMSKKAKIV